ncbi:SDR family NAD(P)-dependent oxidoreductase [Rhizobium sp. C4]|uniref:SDR family NAD(P)-dependent oxidoreductase n=1 Tax=Rhizobium sp. C4 TaxID=1349800 RepID=UPI001E629076|nr:SDR family NAD(P)-dependent oxidoreductase [Rhizobium sp. C4]MCD2172272.1 SDR family oxidoreductase [Rhizobium sp. C4]
MEPPITSGRAIVTGGATGIGLGIAKRLSADGFAVTLVSRDRERLQSACSEVGGGADFIVCDVGNRNSVQALASEVRSRHGEIAVLVNNAGIMKTTLLSTPADEMDRIWDETLAVNLKGAMMVSQELAPILRSPGGRIINLSSTVAYNGGSVPGLIAYSASKAGITGLTMALARELAERDITVNAVAPGMIEDTGLTGTFDASRKARIQQILPLKRPGQPHEVAAAVSYLASPDAGYVTGTVMSVNGGWIFR